MNKVQRDKLFEELPDDIHLDDKVMQDIANDLKSGKQVEGLDQHTQEKLLDIDKKVNRTEAEIKQDAVKEVRAFL